MICKYCHREVTPLKNGTCPACKAHIAEEQTTKKVSTKKQEEKKNG